LSSELESARFLAGASAALAQVADYESTLERIANLAVPSFADWFGVHIREPEGIRRLAVRHLDAQMQERVTEMYRRYPPNEANPYGAPRVLATGERIWAPDFSAIIPAVARDSTHEAMLRGLGLRSFICVPMRSHGEVVGALTFATAESGRTYDEVHLQAAEDLATRAAIAIENAQLIERLREADKRKDEFLAMLAHELRNPLAPIHNATQYLRMKRLLPAQDEWVHDVLDRQVRNLSRLVDDLLDVSRITNGRIELRKARMPMADAVDAGVEWSRPRLDAGKYRLDVRMPGEPMVIDADAVRVSQIVSNLLDNAAKFSPPGSHIHLSVEREGENALIRVADTGAGIPGAMLDRIFDMFVQAEAPAVDGRGGLGIGLALVRRLAELHGGSVLARSAGAGQGSEFVVTLPMTRAAAHAGSTA
jgi:signal transduction histidine kinase